MNSINIIYNERSKKKIQMKNEKKKKKKGFCTFTITINGKK